MSDRAERELSLGDVQALDERAQRGIGASAGAIDRRVTRVFAVTLIIDKQKRVTVVWITRENGHPIKRERAIPTEGDPNTFLQLSSRRHYATRLFPHRHPQHDFCPIPGNP